MIRTLAEVRTDRLTITITEETPAEPLTIDAVQPAVDRDEVERLSRHVRELGDRCRAYDEDRTTERDRADRLKGELKKSQEATALALNDRDRLARRVGELERSLARSIDRENRLETERAEVDAENRQSIAARDQLLAVATGKLKRIQARVWGGRLDEVVEHRGGLTGAAQTLGDAVAFVRSVTGQPEA